jgi:hypothetical protein
MTAPPGTGLRIPPAGAAPLRLEKHFREQSEAKLRQAGEHDSVNQYYVEYISKVVAAIHELNLETEFETEVPSIRNVSYNTYADFGKDVDHYRTKLSIRNARRTKGYSVSLDDATKTKIRHHLEQVRSFIEKLEVSQDKKEELLKKLNAFSADLDRARARYEAWGDVVIQAAEVLGEAAEKAEPARKWLDSIGRLIWGAKEKENEMKQLPPPREPKRI